MLNHTRIQALKPKVKTYSVADSDGLTLVVRPNGKKVWWYRYRYAGKQKTYTIGEYPSVGLAEARQKRDEAKKWLIDGKDPVAQRQHEQFRKSETSFQTVAEAWMEKQKNWTDETRSDRLSRFNNHIFPFIGAVPVEDVSREALINIINRMTGAGLHTKTIGRIYGQVINVYKHAIAAGMCERNVAYDLKPLLPVGDQETPRKSLSKEDVPTFLNALDDYNGRAETIIALKLLVLTGARPGEIQKALWSEFDLDAKTWSRSSERMKMRRDHDMPLSRQALEQLNLLHTLTGHRKQLFPHISDPDKFMSENTLNQAIQKRMGFDATAHGMRSVFSTLMNEMGFNPDAIERQLAHEEANKVRRTYNRAKYWDERVKLVQQWADYLDSLRDGAEVIPFRRDAMS